MDLYLRWLLLFGVACFGAAWLPHLVRGKPISFPMLYVAFGAAVFALPLGLPVPDPLRYPHLTERLSELIVIISLTGVGLKLKRPVGWRSWGTTWRLLGITMPLSIAGIAAMGYWGLGLDAAGAVLLGAVLAPTDPVLAVEVQAAPPQEGEDSEVRFALTSEAGLNDGLAFPFTNLAIALAVSNAGNTSLWQEWAWYDVFYKVFVGVAAGIALGYGLAWLLFRVGRETGPARVGEGIAAVAITLIAYSATEAIHGYGFLAVFVTAVTLRHFERDHEYHRTLHALADDVERMLMAALLVLLGGAAVGGLLEPLTWPAAAAGVACLLLVRPVAGWVALIGSGIPRPQRAAIAFFGIRGLGSVYYLAHALNDEPFARPDFLWAVTGFVILLSVALHGTTAAPVMRRIDPEGGAS